MKSMMLPYNLAFSEDAEAPRNDQPTGIPRITMRQLVYFVAAATNESAIRAAEQLNVSPPAISGAISALESILGEQLFIRRHARGLMMTEAGRHLLFEARDIIDRVKEIEALRLRGAGQVNRRVFLGCLGDVATRVVPPLMRTFQELYPNADLRITTADYDRLMTEMDDGALDMVLALDFERSPSTHVTVLQQTPAYCCLPKSHPLAGGPVDLAHLVDEPFIMLDMARTREYFLAIFSDQKLTPKVAYRAASADMVRSLVAHGFGYSLLNFSAPGDTEITYQPIRGETRPANLVAIRPQRRRSNIMTDRLIETAREVVGKIGLIPTPAAPVEVG
ncbi:LysR substrate-binding domain-containing protein [Acuticoccus mangrovi]|uniref:LysR family transcriptional regulator n=1 Tax=Acuticoccus mangrovi TaxID=2796142 RepID=A0A934MIP7_9HYPH|nr:LysR substrate-binding domain-containing protein [Acuticoccus mangrovi]MBJ3778135.1 LysR family transcriptional regulator [Acuticoccus mangrovi]